MKKPRKRFRHLFMGAIALCSFVATAPTWSQSSRAIRIIVPFPAGGTADLLARILGQQISWAQGVSMSIENRPGAGTIVGTEAVSRAAPDGNTLLLAATAFLVTPHLRKLSYQALSSFEPICQLTSSPMVIAVHSESPYRTLADLLGAARAKPGSLTVASVPASLAHIAFEMLKRAANVDMTLVPYPGDAPAINALLGEHVTATFGPYPGMAEQLKSGRLRVLASASRSRAEPISDVPTIAEFGYKDYEVEFWNGVLAPATTPTDTVSRLASWFTAAMQVPEVKAKLVAQSLNPVGRCGADFGALLSKQYNEFGTIIREANIQAE
jgi:tripartite-type tricarboxylate transporter receptor subunit TctC